MALSDIVNIQISTESVQVEREGFGVPLILGADCPVGFTERVRFYASMSEVDDDFASTTATYKMAAAIFAQDPKLPLLAVGRLANKPTQRWALTPVVGAAAITNYQMRVNDNLISVNTDASPTVAEIIALLKIAIDALALGITVSDQTTFMRIVANTAGATFNIESLDLTKIKVEQDHADPGYAADLAAIALENNTWYGLLNPFNSKVCAKACADYAEANKKLFVCQTQDSNVVLLSLGSDTGGSETIAGQLKTGAFMRTALIYHPETWAFADGAADGQCLPLDPGSETWAFKTLATVDTVALTSTHRTNALAKNVNVYTSVAGVGITEQGKVSGGEYIDVIRFRDWLDARISEEFFAALANADKIPFTDPGIAVIEGILLAVLKEGVDAGGLAADPAPTVTVPAAADISGADRTARNLTGVKFDAILAGAIHAVAVNGTVSTS